MIRNACVLLMGTLGLTVVLGGVGADEKQPSIQEIMKAVGAKDGLCARCNQAAKGEKWADAQKLGKQLAECGLNLTKTKCPKGDAASWEKLTKQYCEQAAAIAKAADNKDAKAFNEAIGAFVKSCKACHDAHK